MRGGEVDGWRDAVFSEMDYAAIADVLGVDANRVNVKVTSTDRLGAIGRSEGIAAQAVALLVETGT